MKQPLLHLATRIFGCPLAIHRAKFDAILGVLGGRLGIEPTLEQIEAAGLVEGLYAAQPGTKSQKTSYTVQDGIAIISITGSLMKSTSGLMAASGSTSYQTIGAQFQDAMNNPAIKGVLLHIDSPGGETSGLFELADLLSSFDGQKPVYAIADDAAFSAAYALASCADRIYLTRTAGVGSIGVFCCHVDQSGADAKAGVKYTFIHAGAKKTDGNAHQPLSNSALTDTQAEVDRQCQMFVSLVAKNRNVPADDIKATEAGCYYGENAVPLLADVVGTFDDALNDLVNGGNAAHINTNSKAEAGQSPALKAEDDKEDLQAMAKKIEQPSIDELVAKHATETADEEEMEKDCKKADAKDGDPDDDEDDEEDDDEKKKPSDSEDDEEAKKSKKKADSGRADAVRIVNLCTLANMPTLAAEFLTAGYTVADVEKALLKHRAGKSRERASQDCQRINDVSQ